jgi:hypothetical protein
MNNRNAVASLTVVMCLVFGVVLGCGGGSSDNCIGTVNYQGKTFQGAGKNEIDAKLFACNNYCSDADPDYDARYRIWLDSPKGKAAGNPTKREAMFKDKALLDFVTDVCARKCTAEMKPEAKCK